MDQHAIDIGILTIREDEFDAVLKALPKEVGIIREQREYSVREADAGDGKKYRVAVVRQVEQGNGAAQDCARDLIADLEPSLVIVVGIAGGVPSSDFSLGDVVLSSRIYDYSVEARKFEEEPAYSVSGGPIAKRITNGLANLRSRKEMQQWHKDLRRQPAVSLKPKSFYGPRQWLEKARDSIESHFGKQVKRKLPNFVTGAIASSDRLVKDPAVLIPLLKSARHIYAIEMESAGVYHAARERCPMLAIRGISDIVGVHRDDAWTKYACEAAAAAMKAYLSTQPVEPKSQSQNEVPDDSILRQEALFMNLIEVSALPKKIFIAPTSIPTMKVAWGKLRGKTEKKPGPPIPSAWTIHAKNVYSFIDPSETPLANIIDESALEEHDVSEFFANPTPDRQHLLAQLLRKALQEDLAKVGIRFFADDNVYAFLGWPGEPDRKFRYQNVRLRSEITVVTHKKMKPKTDVKKKKGRTKPKKADAPSELIRHLSFSGRFIQLDDKWYLEITPTYRFTYDGKNKSFLHERSLKFIKRLEKNRAVLSQVLLFTDLLCTLPEQTTSPLLLAFQRLEPFQVEASRPKKLVNSAAPRPPTGLRNSSAEIEL